MVSVQIVIIEGLTTAAIQAGKRVLNIFRTIADHVSRGGATVESFSLTATQRAMNTTIIMKRNAVRDNLPTQVNKKGDHACDPLFLFVDVSASRDSWIQFIQAMLF